MGLIARLSQRLNGRAAVIPAWLPGQDNYWPFANIGGQTYPLNGLQQTLLGKTEEIESDFLGLVQGAYQRNGVVFACMLARSLVFSEARFQFQRFTAGRPGDLFGTPELDILERPWPGGVTADLLAAMLADADLAGTAYVARISRKLVRLRPDWVTIVLGSFDDADVEAGDPEAEILGYVYHPGGRYSGRDPVRFLREQVAQFQYVRDPVAMYRGMSWLTPLVTEVQAHSAATAHKLMFFRNGATPNMVVTHAPLPGTPEVQRQAFADWVAEFRKAEPKGWQAYKTLHLAAGADAKVVGADLKQLDFKVTQGHSETAIAAAARVPPIIVGLSEGLEAATYSNYGQARRAFADLTMRPLWRNAAGSLETIIRAPSGARLWYDDRDIAFLREDRKDAAEIHRIKAVTIRQLVDAGYRPESVVKAVEAEDMGLLAHSGLFSVQLQPPRPSVPVQVEAKPIPVPQLNSGRSIEDAIAASEARIYRAMDREQRIPPIMFADGAFRLDPQITVHTPELAAPIVNVTMPEQAAPVVNMGDVTVEAPPPAEITVNVPEQMAPAVTFEEGAIRVDAPPPAEITVNVEQEPPQVTVNLPEPRAVRKTPTRNDKGQITSLLEEPV